MNIWGKLDIGERKEIQRIYKTTDSDTVARTLESVFGDENLKPRTYGREELFAERPSLKEQYEKLCDVWFAMGAGRKICSYWLLSFIREQGYEAYNPNDSHWVIELDNVGVVSIMSYHDEDYMRRHKEPVLIFTDWDEAKRFLDSNRELIKNYLDTKSV